MTTWNEAITDTLWTSTLGNGRTAAIWAYPDSSGATAYKLLTDRDLGDYVGLDFAMAAADVASVIAIRTLS